jgi:hypothetical protein
MVEKHAAEKEKRRLELKELRKQGKNRQLNQLRGQTLEVKEGMVPVWRRRRPGALLNPDPRLGSLLNPDPRPGSLVNPEPAQGFYD